MRAYIDLERKRPLLLIYETKRQGRIAHHHTDATVPHIVALLGSTFHAANIRLLLETSKLFAQKKLISPNKYLFIFG